MPGTLTSTPRPANKPAPDERDVSGAAALFRSFLSQLASYAPSEGAIRAFKSLISPENALKAGVRIAADRVIADAMTEFAAQLPHLLEGEIGRASCRERV